MDDNAIRSLQREIDLLRTEVSRFRRTLAIETKRLSEAVTQLEANDGQFDKRVQELVTALDRTQKGGRR
jgi:predicted  nucleic acid-binding Zn-ribbon protein